MPGVFSTKEIKNWSPDLEMSDPGSSSNLVI